MRTKTGFTVIEAVVLIGILAILAVLLYPIFLKEKPPNPHHGCQSNLKQIMLGFKQYEQDANELFPPVNAKHQPVTNPPCSGFVNSLQPYLKSVQVFQCRVEPHSIIGQTDYSYNRIAAGNNETIFNNSANSVMLCEASELPGHLAVTTHSMVVDRFLEGSNYAFVDGHVKWLQSTKAPSASNVPATGSNFTFGS